jgi:hypothetical protein
MLEEIAWGMHQYPHIYVLPLQTNPFSFLPCFHIMGSKTMKTKWISKYLVLTKELEK